MENEYTNKLKLAIKGQSKVVIDAANLEQSVKDMWVDPKEIPDDLRKYSHTDLRWGVNYKKLKEFFLGVCDGKVGICTVGEIGFYTPDFQTESHRGFLVFLKKTLGFKLETKPLKEYQDHTPENPHRKANFDVEIAVDAVESINQYKTYILFSGDCDFEYLIKYLRGKGKIVIVFSRKGHIAKELPPASSYYFDVVDFRKEFLRIKPKNKK